MLLIDFSYFCISSLFNTYKTSGPSGSGFQEDLLRHLILDAIRKAHVAANDLKHPVVIACDGRSSWRKTIFPHYKASRKATRDKASHIDWDRAFAFFEVIKEEMRTYTPWIVIDIPSVEADDVIGVLALNHKDPGSIVVVSPDKDYIQLKEFMPDIKLYNPKDKAFISRQQADGTLNMMIIEGDSSDGIPNVLSDDDTFVNTEKRQTKLTAKAKQQLLCSATDTLQPQIAANWHRNRNLIDMRAIPPSVSQSILSFKPRRSQTLRLYEYFSKYQLITLLDKIQDFK